MSDDIERRGFTAELRAEPEGHAIMGYAAMFGQRTDIGGMTEEIAPGAFDDVLADDVRALFNHDPDHILGRTANGTLRITQDEKGLRFEVDINEDDPTAMSLLSRVKRGDVSGNSFSFSVSEDSWNYDTDTPHRTITRLGRLYDLGPVTFPAYEATELSARTKEAAERERPAPEPVLYDHMRRRLDLLD